MHSSTVVVSTVTSQQEGFLCGVSMFSLCLCWFSHSPQTCMLSYLMIVNWLSVNSCLSLCDSPVIRLVTCHG